MAIKIGTNDWSPGGGWKAQCRGSVGVESAQNAQTFARQRGSPSLGGLQWCQRHFECTAKCLRLMVLRAPAYSA